MGDIRGIEPEARVVVPLPGGPIGPTNPLPLSYGGTGLSSTPGPYTHLAANGAGVLAWRPRGDRVQLARLSNPAGGYCLWYTGQYIGTLSHDRVYSDAFIFTVAEYTAVGPETLLDWSVALYSATGVAFEVAVWTITAGGTADTGIRIRGEQAAGRHLQRAGHAGVVGSGGGHSAGL